MVASRAAIARPNYERLFYSGMAIAMVLTVFVGFAPSYYLRGYVEPYAPTLPMTTLSHVHGLLFTAWTLLFLLQTLLVPAGRRDLHRKLGLVAFLLLPAMITVATLASLHGALRHAGPPDIPPLQFLAVPLFDIPVFAILIGAGLWWRRDAQTHKRLMILTMVGMMGPALGRIPWPAVAPPPVIIFGIPDLYLVALVGWDLASRGRLHRATIWGGALLIGSQVLRVAIMGSPAWIGLAGNLVGLVS